jgi:hypothetical protein
MLIFSSVFSFISIRTSSSKREILLEKIADYFFILSLIGILVIVLFIMVSYSF